jgi:hypothetical protein
MFRLRGLQKETLILLEHERQLSFIEPSHPHCDKPPEGIVLSAFYERDQISKGFLGAVAE